MPCNEQASSPRGADGRNRLRLAQRSGGRLLDHDVEPERERLLWIPRDLWCNALGDRINAAYRAGGHARLLAALREHDLTPTHSFVISRTVSETKLKALSGLAEAALFTTHQPGRLVLVGIRYDASGNRLDKALVVTAELTGAKKS